MVSIQITFRCFNRIIDGLCHFVSGTADIAFMAIPCAPHRSALSLLDVNRIPNHTPRVIMAVNLFYWHEDLLSVTRNLAQKRAEAIALPTDLQSRKDMIRSPAEDFAQK